MTTFSALQNARPPARTLLVPVSCFADTWARRPTEDVCAGLRLIAAGDVFTARAEAAKSAWAAHPHEKDIEGRTEAYNDSLIRWIVARGTCDPNNVIEPWELWGGTPEDTVFEALTTYGVRFIFDAIDAFSLETSPTQAEATDEDIAQMAERLVAATMEPEEQHRARRLLGFVAQTLADRSAA